MNRILAALRRHVVAVCAVLAIASIVALGVVRPGPIGAFFTASTSSAQQTRGCDSDRGQDRSDGRDHGTQPAGCPPCPKQVGYTGNCDGDDDADDR